MYFFNTLDIVHGHPITCRRVRKEKGVVGIAGWMLLGLEEGVKVPERGLDVLVCGHFREPSTGFSDSDRSKGKSPTLAQRRFDETHREP